VSDIWEGETFTERQRRLADAEAQAEADRDAESCCDGHDPTCGHYYPA
jgi:hypothetical protein